MKPKWVYLLKTGLLFVRVGACMTMAPLSIPAQFSPPSLRIGLQPAAAAEKYGILGREAPELDLKTWIDGDGDATAPIRLGDYRGSVVYLYFFQVFLPGLVPRMPQVGVPDTEEDHASLHGQRSGQMHRHSDGIRRLPFQYAGQTPAEPGQVCPENLHGACGRQSRHPPGATDHERLPLWGTPWAVVIDPTGRVAYNGFHIEADEAKALIDRLIGDLD